MKNKNFRIAFTILEKNFKNLVEEVKLNPLLSKYYSFNTKDLLTSEDTEFINSLKYSGANSKNFENLCDKFPITKEHQSQLLNVKIPKSSELQIDKKNLENTPNYSLSSKEDENDDEKVISYLTYPEGFKTKIEVEIYKKKMDTEFGISIKDDFIPQIIEHQGKYYYCIAKGRRDFMERIKEVLKNTYQLTILDVK